MRKTLPKSTAKKLPRWLIAAVLFPVLAGCASTGSTRAQDTYDAAHFQRTVTVKDDSLEPVATISTEYGWQPAPNFLVGPVHDTFFRAFVDKKSGETAIQVYSWVRYPGEVWRGYYQANFESLSGLQSVSVVKPGQPNADCSSRTLGCVYLETIGFDVPEQTLRDIAAQQKPDSTFWRFRLKARTGADYNGLITFAEIRGLLAKLDSYRADMNSLEKPGK